MKKLKQIVEDIKLLDGSDPERLQELLWKLICYSPKMPGRLHQQELTDNAVKGQLKVYDEYFSQSELGFNTFSWGKGPVKVLLTHGWVLRPLISANSSILCCRTHALKYGLLMLPETEARKVS